MLFLLMATTTAFAEGRGGKGGATPSQVVVEGVSMLELFGMMMIVAAVILGGVYFMIRASKRS